MDHGTSMDLPSRRSASPYSAIIIFSSLFDNLYTRNKIKESAASSKEAKQRCKAKSPKNIPSAEYTATIIVQGQPKPTIPRQEMILTIMHNNPGPSFAAHSPMPKLRCHMHHLAPFKQGDQCHHGHSLKEILRHHNTTTQKKKTPFLGLAFADTEHRRTDRVLD
ncbi:hypothetical protein BJX76DRAFT_51243 [Aspergillus varians]